jgi:TPR repeat protein
LGLIHLHGQGVPLNAPQAERWFKLAWAQQERIASAGLAWCALDGCSGPANPTQARQWIQVLRVQQPGRAQYLEWLLAHKLAPVEALSTARSGSPQELEALLRKAVALGDVQAQSALGRQLFAQDRFADALKQFNLAALQSPAAARNVDLVKARMALESAPGIDAKARPRPALDPDAVYLQARRLHRGEGVPANYTEAIRLYLLADRLGHREARRMLSLIYSRPQASGEVDIGWMRQLADMDISLPSPRLGQPAHGLVLHEDLTPLMDWLPVAWRL